MLRVAAAPHPLAALRRLIGTQEAVLLLAIIALFVVVGTINPRFVSDRNLQSIFLGNAYIAVAAIGLPIPKLIIVMLFAVAAS